MPACGRLSARDMGLYSPHLGARFFRAATSCIFASTARELLSLSALVVSFSLAAPSARNYARCVSDQIRERDFSQNIQDARLELGQTLKREIKGGASYSFNLSLTTGQYARVLIEQRGIILSAQLLDLEGKPMLEMDNPSGGNGPIYLSAIASTSGDYRLIVQSIEAWANPGQFEASIENVREATPADTQRLAAEKAFAEGRQLANRGTKDSREAAIKKYNDALGYWTAVSDGHWQTLTLYSIARVYRGLGQYARAEEIYRQMTPFSYAAHDWRLRASYLNDRGLNYSDENKYEIALESLNLAASEYQNHDDKRGQASVFNNIGLTYHRMGALAKAMENYEKAIPLRRAENDQQGEFNVRNNIGGIYDVSGDPVKALELYQATLKVWQDFDGRGELRDRDQLGSAFNNVGETLNKLGRWQEARDNYQAALSIFQKSGNGQREATCLDNLGQLYQDLGDPDLALDYHQKALAQLQKFKNAELEANVLSHLGTVNISRNNLEAALKNFQMAFELRQNDRGKGYALLNIGAVKALQKSPQRALEVYLDALQLIRKAGDERGEALLLYKIGEADDMIGSHAQALEAFNQARLLWQKIKDARGEATTLYATARAEAELGDVNKALADISNAVAIVESLRTNILGNRIRASYFATQQAYYELNIGLNMEVFGKSGSTDSLGLAFQTSERSRARGLIDTFREARAKATNDGPDGAFERELQQQLNAKAQAQSELLNRKHTEDQASAIETELNSLINQYDELQAKIISNNPKYADLVKPSVPTVQEIQNQLGPDSLLVEYSLGEQRSYVWAVTSSSIDGFMLPPRDVIEATANRIVKSLADRNRTANGETGAQYERRRGQADKDFDAASAELSDLVIRQVAPLLGNKRLVIVADGALQRVSFAALPLPRAGADQPRRLIDDHEIVYEPSASVLALQRSELGNRRPAPRGVAILADPVFDKDDSRVASALPLINPPRNGSNSTGGAGGENATQRREVSRALEDIGLERFPRLNSSASEAKRIISVAPKGDNKEALNFDASRETATSTELSRYRIVHFATHAVVNYEHPELSGIVLSLVDRKGQPQDGYLRLHDIYNLNLPADLVVLSACQTGVGKEIKGEGLIALTRGFMYAGAQRVVASLWKVDDVATSNLMAEFYKQMFVSGQRPAAALRAAQISLARKNHSPADWAGFVLQGEWK